MCPITRKQLSNSTKCYLVKPTGAVVSKEGVALILAEKLMDGKKVKKSDIIPLSGGGTGFAGNGAKIATSTENKYVYFWRFVRCWLMLILTPLCPLLCIVDIQNQLGYSGKLAAQGDRQL